MTKIAKMEDNLSKIAGHKVELTIRGDRAFTISSDEMVLDLDAKVAAFFGKAAKISASHDEECGSFVYIEV